MVRNVFLVDWNTPGSNGLLDAFTVKVCLGSTTLTDAALSSRFDCMRTKQAIKHKQKNYFQNLILSVTHASYVFNSCINIVDNFGKDSFDSKMQKFSYADVNGKWILSELTAVTLRSSNLNPWNFLNEINDLNLDSIDPNLYTSFWIFLVMPATADSADCSCMKLKLKKSYFKSSVSQGRLFQLCTETRWKYRFPECDTIYRAQKHTLERIKRV